MWFIFHYLMWLIFHHLMLIFHHLNVNHHRTTYVLPTFFNYSGTPSQCNNMYVFPGLGLAASELDGLQNDSYVISSKKSGIPSGSFVVTGGKASARGTMFAAYDFLRLLGNGREAGLRHLEYTYQEGEGGIADALSLAEDFADGGRICVVLGDNIFQYSIRPVVEDASTGTDTPTSKDAAFVQKVAEANVRLNGLDGRIDDPDAGWKGRGLWANYGGNFNWHIEGGKGTPSKMVHFQLRPDPLAR